MSCAHEFGVFCPECLPEAIRSRIENLKLALTMTRIGLNVQVEPNDLQSQIGLLQGVVEHCAKLEARLDMVLANLKKADELNGQLRNDLYYAKHGRSKGEDGKA